jgi:hypothetical protein
MELEFAHRVAPEPRTFVVHTRCLFMLEQHWRGGNGAKTPELAGGGLGRQSGNGIGS